MLAKSTAAALRRVERARSLASAPSGSSRRALASHHLSTGSSPTCSSPSSSFAARPSLSSTPKRQGDVGPSARAIDCSSALGRAPIRAASLLPPLACRPYASTAHARRPDPPEPEDDVVDDEPSIPLPDPAAHYDTPRKLHALLDQFVIAQTKAKKVLSTAVYNHYLRTRHNLTQTALEEQEARDAASRSQTEAHIAQGLVVGEGAKSAGLSRGKGASSRKATSGPVKAVEKVRMSKSNVLLVGPTGSGKTLLVQTLATALSVPFATINATTLTQAGYIGDDVEVCIARLLQAAAFDTDLAGVGIVYLDEVDKLAKSDGAGGNGEGRTKDVGGLGVQQALLRLLEGNVVSVTMKGGPDPDAMPPPSLSVHPHSSADLQPSPGRRRKTSPFPSLKGAAGGTGGGFGPSMQASGSKHEQTYSVDTSNVLFIMSGAFVDLDKTILARTRQTGMGFGAVLPKPCKDDEPAAAAAEETGAYRDPSRQEPKTVLDDLELGDLVSYGFIPEFIGRLPVVASLRALTQTDLLRILCEPRNSLVKQFAQLLAESGAELKITTPALKEIAKEAVRKGTGARALTSRMESLLQEPLYDVPGSSIRHVLITAPVVLGRSPPLYFSRGEKSEFYSAALEDEERALGLGKAGMGMAVGGKAGGSKGGGMP